VGQQEAGPARAGLFVLGGLNNCSVRFGFVCSLFDRGSSAGCEVDRGRCASWLNALAQETQPDEPGQASGITKSLPRAGVFL
jgi:hypothetical protein